MKRNEFIKKATTGLAAIVLTGKYDLVAPENEDLDFIINYLNAKVDFSDIPADLDVVEKALTSYIRGELSKQSTVKILMYFEGDTEEEALYEINNLTYATKKQQENFEQEEEGNKTNMKQEDYHTPGGGFGFGSVEPDFG